MNVSSILDQRIEYTRSARRVYSTGATGAGSIKRCNRSPPDARWTAHTLHHSFTKHLLEDGVDVRTTQLYTHVSDPARVRSPLDDSMLKEEGSVYEVIGVEVPFLWVVWIA